MKNQYSNTKLVYSFNNLNSEGHKSMVSLLGNKGANLAEMCLLGIPVPPGFTITTDACQKYYEQDKTISKALEIQVFDALSKIEKQLKLKLSDNTKPLLLSVRSGASVSMPGMMDTVLNLGLNDITVEALAKKTSNPRFAYDCYRRFIEMYSDVVAELELYVFQKILENKKLELSVKHDYQLDVNALQEVILEYKKLFKKETGEKFPQDIKTQFWNSVKAVFNSWSNNRAMKYREIHNITECYGTAVNIQAMVFGNMGKNSATGVSFTRNPSTGEKKLYGEFLINAQGEDVVSGTRTPYPLLKESNDKNEFESLPSMEEIMPDNFQKLTKFFYKLERDYHDMQDIEFTIQEGKIWILQTRAGKRTAKAAVKIATDMVVEGLIDKNTALKRIDASSVDKLLHAELDPNEKKTVITKGLPASPGAASGAIVLSCKQAEALSKEKNVILVRSETSPEDIAGMNVATGVLTVRGGMTSHAAVIARGMGKPCITGASQITIDCDNKCLHINGRILKEGDIITINGATGEVILGKVSTIRPDVQKKFAEIIEWADNSAKIIVRANAETPNDVQNAYNFGATGIGLCRTEHMFFAKERMPAVREMILAEDKESRLIALDKLLPYQKYDFKSIFRIMKDLPVTIRLLDPPLHEFLPNTEEELQNLSKTTDVSVEKIKERIFQISEINPMLGHRGCRLAVTYPEIYEMQIRAILESAIELKEQEGLNIIPEIMIPLIMNKAEFLKMKSIAVKVESLLKKDFPEEYINYKIGSMIELPIAAFQAGEIAKEADFLSFGTNDLTQTCLGISRDDSSKFLLEYQQGKIFQSDPFASLDRYGVAELVSIAVERARKTNPDIKLGVCGEQGADPKSIEFFHKIGMDYVSCSPYRILTAKIAAAQTAMCS